MGRELRDRERLRCKGRGLAASSARARRQEHDRGAGGLRPRASGQNPATAKQRQRNDARAQHASVSSTTHHTVPGGHEDTDYRSDLRFPARGAEGPRSRGQARLTEGSLSAETGPLFYLCPRLHGRGRPPDFFIISSIVLSRGPVVPHGAQERPIMSQKCPGSGGPLGLMYWSSAPSA